MAAATAWACGGGWAWSGWLARGLDVVTAPPGVSPKGPGGGSLSAAELLGEPAREAQPWHRAADATADADVAELAARLAELGAPPHQVAQHVAAYTTFRQALRNAPMPRATGRQPALQQPQRLGEAPQPLAGLPAEFDRYARGASAYRFGQVEEARAHWRAVLELPAPERRLRSVWAAYMLGRSWMGIDAERAERRLIQATELAEAGYADALSLSAEAWGWRGRLAMDRGDWPAALEAYRRQWRGGGAARASLIALAHEVLALDGAQMAAAAGDPGLRRLVTRVVAVDAPWWWELPTAASSQWLAALEQVKAVDPDGAGVAAAAAYRAGHLDLAERWAERAGPGSALARWTLGKLAVRRGDREDGLAHLRAAAALVEPWEEGRVGYWPRPGALRSPSILGEAGVLETSRGRFVEALGLFVDAGLDQDAAYLAEMVLPVEQVVGFCEARREARRGGRAQDGEARLEGVLARRLARLNLHDEALAWFPPSTAERYAELVDWLAAGDDTALPPPRRADALWNAARKTFFEGPVFYGVSSERLPHVEKRYLVSRGVSWQRAALAERDPAQVHPAEAATLWPLAQGRVAAGPRPPAPGWDRTFPYLAAERAWKATLLMPNNDPETARRLCLAGTWIKVMDPPAADAFYKALVRRCSATTLGAEADRKRWFPRLSDDPDYAVK